jgi:hypothetical protein
MPNGGDMLQKRLVMIIFCGILITVPSARADKLTILKIGPVWPIEMMQTERKTAGDATLIFGGIIDRKVAIGAGLDFLWNTNSEKESEENGYRLKMVERTFMFPLSGYIAITPIPDYMFHPCVSAQVGLNTLYYYQQADTVRNENVDKGVDKNGLYMGLYVKVAADAIYNIGDHSGIFIGIDYQWSQPKKLNVEPGDLFPKDRRMNGLGLRVGFRLMY